MNGVPAVAQDVTFATGVIRPSGAAARQVLAPSDSDRKSVYDDDEGQIPGVAAYSSERYCSELSQQNTRCNIRNAGQRQASPLYVAFRECASNIPQRCSSLQRSQLRARDRVESEPYLEFGTGSRDS